jgi:uncharacterized peroxidase-related enzyme
MSSTQTPSNTGTSLSNRIDAFAQKNGFQPNIMKDLIARPEIAESLLSMSIAVMRSPDSTVDFGLKWLVAHLCSYAYGCQYCAAHTLKNGETAGLSRGKLDAIWDYERSALFSEAERAAFVVAQGAATSPPSVSDKDMENLRDHFSHEQVVEIIAVVSYFGFLNRWNDIMATQLEDKVLDFTDEIGLRSKGWNPERHMAK